MTRPHPSLLILLALSAASILFVSVTYYVQTTYPAPQAPVALVLERPVGFPFPSTASTPHPYCAAATSRFAVVSLYNDPPEGETQDAYGEERLRYATTMLKSVRAVLAVDTIMLVQSNGTKDVVPLRRAGWQVCVVPPIKAGWRYSTRLVRAGVQVSGLSAYAALLQH